MPITNVLTADGRILSTDIEVFDYADNCCPPSICNLDPCGIICNFINLLPRGPLWDEPKAKALDAYIRPRHPADGGVTICMPPESNCSSMVSHSIYTAKRFYDTLIGSLAPALRENSPYTAFDTMDDWLDRLGWLNCFETSCRDCDLGGGNTNATPTPYENIGECGPVFCSPTAPTNLSNATKHGIIVALSRLQMGVVKNLEGINWVIEPLNAVLSKNVLPCDTQGELRECSTEFKLDQISTIVPLWRRISCPDFVEVEAVSISTSYTDANCITGATPRVLYPMLLAADCIVRSLITNSSVNITRSL